ncbi:hypothetical protein [Sutcliffiella sp. NC1]|uniref:hypothetical protein n=1 Tax=Sutcliffiella sp. NC1 TaxID=3004096 RepID=UPI0022DDE63D|nr:hypothetical protein [Sutcliffiella sp. NC1]WBL13829.1 hypothetical protein O1A01_18215 [Sutcliffiella sp. NC1]
MKEARLLDSEDLVKILNNAKSIGDTEHVTSIELVNIMKQQLQRAMSNNKEK